VAATASLEFVKTGYLIVQNGRPLHLETDKSLILVDNSSSGLFTNRLQ